MNKASDVARYLLSLDTDGSVFNKKLINRNGRNLYEGNARLNKYLHLGNNIYLAKTGKPLFSDVIYAYDNGGIVKDVQENYARILANKGKTPVPDLPEEDKEFLRKLYVVLAGADVDQLITLSHQDPEWQKKHTGYYTKEQEMDSAGNVDRYRKQYKDIIRIMDGMSV